MKRHDPKRALVATGLVALDVVYVDDNEEPSYLSTGGTCGNVAAILGALGWRSTPIGRLEVDAASTLVKSDLRRWGVDTALIQSAPAAATPIIIERLRTGESPRHSFSWNCPCCGQWLPRFSPLGVRAVERLIAANALPEASIFFFDRAFPGAVKLAEHYRTKGALIVFEPSAKSDPAVFFRALATAHIVKYAEDRLARLPAGPEELRNLQLEIQTSGASGMRYRGRAPGINFRDWNEHRSLAPGRLVDSAGSGDWFTAGFLDHLVGEVDAVAGLDKDKIDAAIMTAQSFAAWNCRYVGARGGMYAEGWSRMRLDAAAIIDARTVPIQSRQQRRTTRKMDRICPSCATSVPQAKAR